MSDTPTAAAVDWDIDPDPFEQPPGLAAACLAAAIREGMPDDEGPRPSSELGDDAVSSDPEKISFSTQTPPADAQKANSEPVTSTENNIFNIIGNFDQEFAAVPDSDPPPDAD